MPFDPVELTQALIRCPSVTPKEAGALDLLEQWLSALGMSCQRLPFQQPGTERVDNLFATIGEGDRHFLFAGHSDVVPTGPLTNWSVDPFAAEIIDNKIFGRGAADMKGAIAAFVVAAQDWLHDKKPGRLSLLITGDEEGIAINGTKPVLAALAQQGYQFTACLVGEPTNPTQLGEMIKIGRRGSMTGRLTVKGIQGHSAYPHLAKNAAHDLVTAAQALLHPILDEGNEYFQPSNLQITSLDIGNPASNVIPGEAKAIFNIRFNDHYSAATLEKNIRDRLDKEKIDYDLSVECSGESFITKPGSFSDLAQAAIKQVTGVNPTLSTTGGTSDARFIKNYCPVIEFGLVGQTMHKADEYVKIDDLAALSHIYSEILNRFFLR